MKIFSISAKQSLPLIGVIIVKSQFFLGVIDWIADNAMALCPRYFFIAIGGDPSLIPIPGLREFHKLDTSTGRIHALMTWQVRHFLNDSTSKKHSCHRTWCDWP